MAEADLFQQARGFGRRHALEAGEVAQGFRAAELRVEGHVLRQVAELAARLQASCIVAEDPHAAFAGGQQAEDQLDGGGLAGAVVAEQAEHLAGLQAQADATEDYPTYALPIVNHSPGGYCLSWPKEVPAQLQAGELVGLQDLPGQAWSIAVVRWIRQVRNGGTQMGIEMIAPAAQPCGLQLLRKTEQSSHYLRALLLPEIAAISRPATVITPRLPFQEGSRVQINLHGEERRAVLNRRQASTGSFSQFEYRSAEPVNTPSDKPVTAPVARPPAGEEDFDSLWKSL